jgi:anti-sigma factor RsiW
MAEEHVRQWLSAYLDNELSNARRIQLEAHLAACDACTGELQTLRGLSSLLQESVAPAPWLSQEQFAAIVMERLPANTAPSSWRQMLWAVWWAAPPLALLGWVFQQLIAWALDLYQLANLAGWLGLKELELPTAGTATQAMLASGLQGLVAWLQVFTPLGLGVRWLSSELLGLWSSAALVLLLACWLASWWMLQKNEWTKVSAKMAH